MTIWAAVAASAMLQSAHAAGSFNAITRQIPERGEVKSAQFKAGRQNTSFILPAGWRIGASDDGLALQSKDFGASIEVTVIPGVVSATEVEKKIQAKTPCSKITREFKQPTRLGAAIIIESEHATEGQLRLSSRTILIVQDEQTVQFSLVASPEKFREHRKAFENMVASYRVD